MRFLGFGGWLIGCILLLTVGARAHAQGLPYDWRERLIATELTESLTQEAERAYTWRVSWTAINGAVAVASMAGLLVLPRSQRPSLIVGSIASGLACAMTWAWPLAVEADAFEATQLVDRSAHDRIPRLRELYAHAARDESDRVHWTWHLINIATSLVPALIIWIGYHQLFEGASTGWTGLALSELALVTQPTRLGDRTSPQVRLAFGAGRLGVLGVW